MTDSVQPASTGTAPGSNEVGEALARARAALGLSLEDCAQQLKFAPRKLEAMEQGRFDQLPGGTFARGMVRAYARLLNLDADSLVARIAPQVEEKYTIDTAVSLRRPIPFASAGKRGNLLYAGLSLVALAVVAWAGYGWQQERSGTAKLTFVPAARAPAEPPKAEVVATVTPVIAPIRQDRAEEQPAHEAKPPAVAAAEPAPPPEPGKRRIVLRFERDAWVEVRAGNGKTIHSQLNRAGSERTIDGEPPFKLVVGNAQHVRLTYDDQPVELSGHTKSDVARLTLQ